jgi:predicted phage baseplate assembly protein
MPIRVPALDDRSFDDLVEELLARIPAHTPEYTNPRLGDPGRTLIELFAWLVDTMLYRANLIPERQRLAFLRLLGMQLRAAVPATGLVSIALDDAAQTEAVSLREGATLQGPANFESRTPLTVLPITAEAFCKREATRQEKEQLGDVITGLEYVYQVRGQNTTPYVTTPVFTGGLPEEAGFDLMSRTVDKSLWLALLAPQPELRSQVRTTLGRNPAGGQQILNVGISPALQVPQVPDLSTPFDPAGKPARIPHVWEISYVDGAGEPLYMALDILVDATEGLTKAGVVRLRLPTERFINAPSNDVRNFMHAGVGPRPPRLDDPQTAVRLVAWLRLRPTVSLHTFSIGWVGINAVEIDQRQTVTGRVIGQSDGSIDQEFPLPGGAVEQETLKVQVEETDRGYQPWQQVDDLAALGLAGRDARVFALDSEAGTIRFGDGLRGRIPETGRRIRIAFMRYGGGRAGNLPAGSLTQIANARDPVGNLVLARLKAVQSLATRGGEDAETHPEAERRIPAILRHRSRSVTAEDYGQLARETPGVQLGRVEVLPRFKPQQRRHNVPGVVSVMTLPAREGFSPPNPRIDRHIIEAVHAYLDTRRPLATELYVIGCEYVQLGITVGVSVLDGFDRTVTGAVTQGFNPENVQLAVREALFRFLWPLAPGGVAANGWELGRPVRDRELEVVVARVPGVDAVSRIKLFTRQDDHWVQISRPTPTAALEIPLQIWQLPELLSVVVVTGTAGTPPEAPDDVSGLPDPFAATSGIAIPVVPKVC